MSGEAEFTSFAFKALWAVASGAIGGLILLWREFYLFKIKIAEQGSMAELKHEVHKLRDVVYKIADRLDIPVAHEK